MNSDIKILIKLFCFQEEISQKNNTNYITPNIFDKNDTYILLIKKTSITKYKNYFSYNTLYRFLKYKTNILDSIKENQIINYKKLNDSIILLLIVIVELKMSKFIDFENLFNEKTATKNIVYQIYIKLYQKILLIKLKI